MYTLNTCILHDTNSLLYYYFSFFFFTHNDTVWCEARVSNKKPRLLSTSKGSLQCTEALKLFNICILVLSEQTGTIRSSFKSVKFWSLKRSVLTDSLSTLYTCVQNARENISCQSLKDLFLIRI